jgi:hypothetical protein
MARGKEQDMARTSRKMARKRKRIKDKRLRHQGKSRKSWKIA